MGSRDMVGGLVELVGDVEVEVEAEDGGGMIQFW